MAGRGSGWYKSRNIVDILNVLSAKLKVKVKAKHLYSTTSDLMITAAVLRRGSHNFTCTLHHVCLIPPVFPRQRHHYF